uniref:Structural maintenance of chromosomes protein 5 n=1 Tax=Trichuris muris TaxID=70415 RepID=A0A5S6PZN2_TRIMR
MIFPALRAEIKRRGDLENERIQVLSRLDRNCVTAYRLLLNNRSKFKGDAWLPLLSIQIGHSLNAILIENAIPIRDLLTFVFENSNDIEIFLDLTKQSGIKVSCGLAPSNPKLPTLVLDDELKSHGFTNVVSDMFDAPNGLKCYLTKLLGLNRICVGSLKTEQRLSVVVPLMSKRYLMVFFTPNLKISSRKSVYSGKLTTRQVGLQNRGIFQSGTSASVLTHMSKELEDKQSELAQLTIERTNLEQKLGECKNAMAPYKEQQNELKQMLGRITSLADQLRLEKESLKRRQEKLPEMQASLCSAADALGPQLWSKLQLLKTARDSLENAHEIAKDLILSNLARSISLFALDNAKEELLKIKSDLYVKKENVFSLQRAFLTRAEQLVRTKIELLDQLGMDSSNVSVKNLSAPVTLPKELRSLPCDLEELTNKITKLEFALNRCRADDEQALKEYTKCCDELERINANYERLGNEVTVSTSELSKVKKQWINEARKLVKSISNRFSYLMKELGYNGEVVLDTPDDKAPIDHYGFKILVAFGSNEFHELNDQHQSGGERSVSIILYILALQELSVVPFRCVDEINQGMDPVNERKVFELMVRMLNGEVSGSELQRTQYIIFTPKLLPNCDFGERTKIWCIFNGMGALPQNTLSSALKNASENTDDDQTDRHPLA